MDKESLLLLAKVALHAERYDDMVTFMKKVVDLGTLSSEERSWLSSAYKNSIGTRRASWRALHSVHHRAERKGEESSLRLIEQMQKKVEAELDTICQDVLQVLDKKLIPAAKETDEKIFYLKMKGDYFRYIAEYAQGEKHSQVAEQALNAYGDASKVASSDLTPAHPLRLGLALNFSVFHFEVMSDPEKACSMAKTAYDEGLAEAESLSEEMYQESSNILQLLRDNLIMWSADQEEN